MTWRGKLESHVPVTHHRPMYMIASSIEAVSLGHEHSVASHQPCWLRGPKLILSLGYQLAW